MPGDRKIAFIGGGNMAEAMIRGFLAGGVRGECIFVSEPVAGRRDFLAEAYGVRPCAAGADAAAGAEVIILAVKPQLAQGVLKELSGALSDRHLIVSLMAGITTAALEEALPAGCRVVRVMPNTPALVLQGAAAVSAGTSASPEDVSMVRRMCELVGAAWVVEEKLMDAVTGLSGSGPAYVFTFIEALADAGVREGLSREAALGLAAQTVLGSAKLVLETREHPAVLKEKVTSPGGTTIAGLHILERSAFRGAVMDAVHGAVVRSMELGKK